MGKNVEDLETLFRFDLLPDSFHPTRFLFEQTPLLVQSPLLPYKSLSEILGEERFSKGSGLRPANREARWEIRAAGCAAFGVVQRPLDGQCLTLGVRRENHPGARRPNALVGRRGVAARPLGHAQIKGEYYLLPEHDSAFHENDM